MGKLNAPGRCAAENETNYPLNKSLGGPQTLSRHFAEKKTPLVRLALEDRLAAQHAQQMFFLPFIFLM